MSEKDRRAFMARVQTGIERGKRRRPEGAGTPSESTFPPPRRITKSLADAFTAALEAADGTVIRVPDAEGARQAVRTQIKLWEARRVFVARSERVASLRLSQWLREAKGLAVAEQQEDGTLGGEKGGAETVRAFLSTADVGITGADLAIAETGTLVLTAAPGHPRMASALPLRHMAILWADQIVPALTDVVPRLKEMFMEGDGSWSTSAISLITGPSRTADIEQTLTIGVHGPRELTVVLVEGL